MICYPCTQDIHEHCEDANCPCQHKKTVTLTNGDGSKVVAPATEEYLAKARLEETKGKHL